MPRDKRVIPVRPLPDRGSEVVQKRRALNAAASRIPTPKEREALDARRDKSYRQWEAQ